MEQVPEHASASSSGHDAGRVDNVGDCDCCSLSLDFHRDWPGVGGRRRWPAAGRQEAPRLVGLEWQLVQDGQKRKVVVLKEEKMAAKPTETRQGAPVISVLKPGEELRPLVRQKSRR